MLPVFPPVVVPPASPAGVHLRWLIQRDLPQALTIEGESFAEPWTAEELAATLAGRNVIALGAFRPDAAAPDSRERLEGFVIYELLKAGIVLKNLAVRTTARRTGVGRALVERVVSKLSWDRRRWLAVQVCEPNLSAQLFFRACGLTCTGIVRQPYQACGHDAYEFRVSLAGPAFPEELS